MTPVQLINIALMKIGITKGIAAVTDDSREAWSALQIYDHYLRVTLRTFAWPFATKYAQLSLTRGPVADDSDTLVQSWSALANYEIGDVVQVASVNYWCIVAHINQTPPNTTYWTTEDTDEYDEVATKANEDWLYAYRWPSDCLFARRFVRPGIGREFDVNPVDYRVGRDKVGLILYVNEPDLQLEYTMVDCDNLWTDDLWLDAFTWNLASLFGPALARSQEQTDYAFKRYLMAVKHAAVVAQNESQKAPDGEASWITGRS